MQYSEKENELISILKKDWVSRENVRKFLNLSDNLSRETLNRIRKHYPLINFQDGKGYKISYNREEIERMVAQERSRANDIYQNIKVLEYYKEKVVN